MWCCAWTHADDLTEVPASAPTSVAITIYRDDLALVTETRTIVLPSAPASTPALVRFDDVMDHMIPTSAVLQGLGGDLAEGSERVFSYDALNPRSLLWRSIGERVLVTRGPVGHDGVSKTSPATVQSAGDGIVLAFADRVEALGCAGLPEQLTFAHIPAGLRAKPSLSTTVKGVAPGQHTVTLSYLVTGIQWQTDYTLAMDDDQQHASLSAWLTLTNSGAQGLQNAGVSVVAGELSRVWDNTTREAVQRYVRRACWPEGTTTDFRHRDNAVHAVMAAAPSARELTDRKSKAIEEMVLTSESREAVHEPIDDYHLYRLPFATDVLAAQAKQVMLLQPRRIALQRLYYYETGEIPDQHAPLGPQPTTIQLRTHNDSDHGLGEALPGGNVNLYRSKADVGPLFTASGESGDTPTDVDWRVSLDESSVVTVSATLVARSARKHWFDKDETRLDTLRFEITNATNEAQSFEFVQSPVGASQRITHNSDPWQMQHGAATWSFALPANSRHTLRYDISYVPPEQ